MLTTELLAPSLPPTDMNRALALLESYAPAVRTQLLAGATVQAAKPGTMLCTSDDGPWLLLLLHGKVRIFLTSADGRQVTAWYARGVDLVGSPVIVARSLPLGVQALTTVTFAHLQTDRLYSQIDSTPDLGWRVAKHFALSLDAALDTLADQAFTSVRQRVARHLLDLAVTRPDGKGIVVPVTQQALADAAGTVRDVVARMLAQMRSERLIRTTAHRIEILDVAGLHAAATGNRKKSSKTDKSHSASSTPRVP